MDSMESALSGVTRDETISLKESEWLSMKNRIATLIGKADLSNFRYVAAQILSENIVAGRGLFCQSVMESQLESPESSDVYAAVVAIINSRFPDVGFLLVKRAALRFKAAHDSDDAKRVQELSRFIAALVNQRVAYEFLGLDVLTFMLLKPSWSNIQTAVSFCRQCGSTLHDGVPHKLKEILSEFRRILRKGSLENRVQVLIGRLLANRRWMFQDSVVGELDVVDDEDQTTHDVSLLHDLDSETCLDRFRPKLEADEDFLEETMRFLLGQPHFR